MCATCLWLHVRIEDDGIPTPHGINFEFDILILVQKTLLSLRDLICRVQLEEKKKPFFLPHKHNTQHKERSFPQNSLKRVLKIYQNPVLQLDIDNGNGPMWTPWMKFIQSWQQKLTFILFWGFIFQCCHMESPPFAEKEKLFWIDWRRYISHIVLTLFMIKCTYFFSYRFVFIIVVVV